MADAILDVAVGNPNIIAVNVEDVLPSKRHGVVSLILLSYTFREEPVQDAEVNMYRGIPDA